MSSHRPPGAGIGPNPFSREANISFEIARPARVTLDIHDPAGRRMRGLIDEPRGVGTHVVVWDGLTDAGTRAPAGVYHARLKTGDATAVKALVVLQ